MVVLTERLSDINSILVFSNSVFREYTLKQYKDKNAA